MKKSRSASNEKPIKGRSLITKIMAAMMLLSVLEVTIFAVIMVASGELNHIKKYSYNLLAEKTENRASYVENMLFQKTALVYETAREVNGITEDYLKRNGLDIGSLRSSKNVSKDMLKLYADLLVSLIRENAVNDAYIILDTGTLYDSDSEMVRAGLYLRDTDTYTNSTTDNKDIYVEMGSSDIAHELGTPLDSEWSPYLTINDSKDFCFYTTPMETYYKNSGQPVYNLGYWSGFSKISPFANKSMKYSIPLVTSEGELYGVIGIGLLEKTVLKAIPINDFFNENACYIIAADEENDGIYDPLIYSGAAYSRLVTDSTVFDENAPSAYNVYEFATNNKNSFLGSIYRMKLYNSGSPYLDQHWALISAATRSSVMNIYDFLINVFVISIIITLVCCAAFSIFTGRRISKPVSKMITMLNNAPKNDGTVLTFSNTGILEIDSLASAIVKLQENANEYASRVSKIITLTDNRIGVFRLNIGNHTVFISESLSRIMDLEGIPHTDITISEDDFIGRLRKIDAQQKIFRYDEDLSEQTALFGESRSFEIRYEKNGSEVWYKFSLSMLNDDIIGLVQDITETVSEKKQIAKYKDDEYTDKLIKANKALRDAYYSARRADNAKMEFLSRMSHDIRTPMNAIIGMTSIASTHIDDKNKVADCLDKISVSGNYLLSLINDILDMSKIESGKMMITEENINLGSFLDGLIEMSQSSAAEKNHTLILRKHIVHENVIGDALRIQQMFINIISNSIKYTNNGGTISVDVTEKTVENPIVGCYEFYFKDNGIGMSEEFLKNIFEPFERAEDERVNKQQGTGLGMAITYNLVKMMNGEIKVKSRLGEGTEFIVTLYLKLGGNSIASDKPDKFGMDDLQKLDLGGRRVLLVDDNILNREIAGEFLDMAGVTVEYAENGKDAADKFYASEPGYYEIIFMDIQMPVMNGYDSAAAIRNMDKSDAKTVPIIAMTADAFAEDVKKALSAGMNEHIAKPLDIDKLVKVLKKWLPPKTVTNE